MGGIRTDAQRWVSWTQAGGWQTPPPPKVNNIPARGTRATGPELFPAPLQAQALRSCGAPWGLQGLLCAWEPRRPVSARQSWRVLGAAGQELLDRDIQAERAEVAAGWGEHSSWRLRTYSARPPEQAAR